jgi:hypothetical protein
MDLRLQYPNIDKPIAAYVGSAVGVLLPDLVPSPPSVPMEYEELKKGVELARKYMTSAMCDEGFLLAELGVVESLADLDIYNVLLVSPFMDGCFEFQLRNYYCTKPDCFVYNRFTRSWISKEPKLAQLPNVTWDGTSMVSISWLNGIPIADSKLNILLILKDYLYPRSSGYLKEVLRLMPDRWDCEVTLDEGVPGCGKPPSLRRMLIWNRI